MKESKSSIEMVREFNEKFGHPNAETPCIPDDKTVHFRSTFLKEEAEETVTACVENDLIGLADGLGDMQYVLDGFFLNAGLAHKKDEIMAEIHRSNMSKACKDSHELQETLLKLYKDNPEQKFDYRPMGGEYVVYRVSDGKIQKSINYSKPNLKAVIYGGE